MERTAAFLAYGALGTAAALSCDRPVAARTSEARRRNSEPKEREKDMKRASAFVIALATVLVATTAGAERSEDLQAPRGHDEQQAPRGWTTPVVKR